MDAVQIEQLKNILCASYQKNVNDQIRDIWREINSMKKMVIIAMSGVILQVVAFIGAVALVLIQNS